MKFLSLSIACVISFASLGIPAQQVQASILWDQSANNGVLGDNLVHQIFPDLPTFSTWQVGDVSFGTAVTISDIHTFNYPFTGTSPGATVPVQITLFAKAGSLPAATDLVGNFGTGVAAYSVSLGVAEIHLSGLSIPLAAGNYWIGITPVAAIGANGQTFALEATVPFGDQTAYRNPGGGFGFGTNWSNSALDTTFGDMSLKIQGSAETSGTVPEPLSLMVWVGLILGAIPVAHRRFSKS